MALFTATLDADTLLGGGGNDLFIFPSAAHAADDLITGGGGTDEVRFTSTAQDGETLFLDPDCEVELVTIGTGVAAAAVATGTQGHDVIASAMSTAVRINGNAGANMLVGGTANDTLFGAAGGDILFGGDGEDRLEGGAGGDVLDGEDGIDTYVVSTLADFTAADVISDSGTDEAFDILEIRTASGVLAIGANLVGVENIRIVGATATSAAGVALNAAVTFGYQIFGNAAANAIGGGSGYDYIEGGAGGDSMTGNAGDDNFIVKLAAHATGDKYVGGVGNDSVIFMPETQQVGAAAIMVVGAGSSGIEVFRVMGEGAHGINAATLGAAAGARFVGNDAANTLTGGAGNDVFWGGGGNDSFAGGAGFDILDYSQGETFAVTASLLANTASGSGAGSDSFSGVEGLIGTSIFDTLTGNALANRIEGLDGNDTITGGAGADTLLGGFGDEVFIYNLGSEALGDVIDGGEEFDMVKFNSTTRGDTLTVRAAWTGVEGIHIQEGFGTTALNVNAVSASAAVTVSGNDGVNILTGSIYADQLGGAGGNDTLDGRGGNDSLFGGDGVDRLLGGAGNDELLGGAGNDRLEGGTGVDAVNYGFNETGGTINLALGIATTEDGTDTLLGIENVLGTLGGDDITGNASDNFLSGGGGNDTFHGSLGADTVAGGLGVNLLTYAGGPAAVIIGANIGNVQSVIGSSLGDSFAQGGSGTIVDLGAGNDTLIASGGEGTFEGGEGIDEISFTAIPAFVLLDGGVIVDLSTTFISGFENLSGSSFSDFLAGDGVNNSIAGGGGADTLYGAGGLDSLSGGAGNDRFGFFHTQAADLDRIEDFASGSDKLELDNTFFAGTLAASTGGVLNGAAFRSATDLSTGGTAGQYILYDSDAGTLYYDADADGDATDATHFATLIGNPTVVASDFLVIA